MPMTLALASSPPAPPPQTAGMMLDTDLFSTFPGPAVLLAGGRAVAGNTDGLALAACLTDPLPVPPAQVRVVVGARQFDLTLVPARDGTMLLARDATLERNLIDALARSRQLFRDLVQCSSEFAWETTVDGRFGFVSSRGALGYAAAELAGRPARDLAGDKGGPWPFADVEPHNETEVALLAKDGRTRLFAISSVPVRDARGMPAGARGVAHDITEARERAAQLAAAHNTAMRLSRTDELTDLLNRRAFVAELDIRLAHGRRHGQGGALLYLDLDNFKAVNDVRGHGTGDTCLRALAAELKACSRVGDLTTRLGGDEFAIWLELSGRQGGQRKADQLVAACAGLQAAYGVPDRPLGLSIGIAVSRPDDDAASLIARADGAMYQAKHGGKNRHALAI